MIIEELDDLIQDVQCWHKVRGGLNRKRGRKPLVMETLPSVIQALGDYRDLLLSNSENVKREWTPSEILEHAG